MNTQTSTIAAMICELIETHMEKCESAFERSEDGPHHVVSDVHETRANIETLSSRDNEDGVEITLLLDDGSAFRVMVEAL
ncbi:MULTISPECIES: hypothetical protein [Sphingomonadaceae]|uniref:hypothetical protein n=1 Tax=Sphingomonadales TaxID=204457 RepID=UPI00077008DC|nr:hypothetical protein [Sphingobium sp. TKS]AMK23246.1 hypothetical protein K426_11550 [Sphingobium sp. TKS]MCF8709078.1 hypothetical protein [Rhizorhapis sp. SPR117]